MCYSILIGGQKRVWKMAGLALTGWGRRRGAWLARRGSPARFKNSQSRAAEQIFRVRIVWFAGAKAAGVTSLLAPTAALVLLVPRPSAARSPDSRLGGRRPIQRITNGQVEERALRPTASPAGCRRGLGRTRGRRVTRTEAGEGGGDVPNPSGL